MLRQKIKNLIDYLMKTDIGSKREGKKQRT